MSWLLVVGVALGAQAEPIGMREYRARLASIDEAVRRGDVETVRSAARELGDLRLRLGDAQSDTDRTVLGPLMRATSAGEAREAAAALRRLRAELESLEPEATPRLPDRALLERLRSEEEQEKESGQGKVGGPELSSGMIPASFRAWLFAKLAGFGRKFWDLLDRLIRWLVRFVLGNASSGSSPQTPTRYLVAALVVAILGGLGLVAHLARRRRGTGPLPADPSASQAIRAGDGDPLSRTAMQWETLAGELMRTGRFREAVRAWYHAVLVSCFRQGLLHYRKDRTNWEYAFALPASVPWRAEFLEAIRMFESEWYGRRQTPAETAELYQRRALEMLQEFNAGAIR